MNRVLSELMSQLGSAAPFTAFADHQSRFKMVASRVRHGSHCHFATYCPVPWEDPTVLRACMLSAATETKNENNVRPFNERTNPLAASGFSTDYFPSDINAVLANRRTIVRNSPGLAAMHFAQSMDVLNKHVVHCPTYSQTKSSHHWSDGGRGAFGHISCVNQNVEARPSDGVLHAHVLYRGPKQGEEALRLASSDPRLTFIMSQYLDTISRATLQQTVHDWQDAQRLLPEEEQMQMNK